MDVFSFIGKIISLITVYVKRKISRKPKDIFSLPERLPGTALSSSARYPVVLDTASKVSIDHRKFADCIHFLLQQNNPLAALDLVYLGEFNFIDKSLNDQEEKQYRELKGKYGLTDVTLGELKRSRLEAFKVYVDIVEGFGETFKGTKTEIALHDVRDPMHSIVKIVNTVTNREEGSPCTDYALGMITRYGNRGWEGIKAGYVATTLDGRKLKSSAIPLEDPRYGLVGIICINIDITDLIKKDSKKATRELVANFILTPLGSNIKETFS